MRPLALTCALMAGCAGGAEKAATPSRYPFGVGMEWRYVDKAGNTYRTRIEEVIRHNDEERFVLRGATVGISDDRWESSDVAVVAVRQGLPVLILVGERDWMLVARDPQPLVRHDLARGATWSGRYAWREDSYKVDIAVGGPREITTPAGRVLAQHMIETWKHHDAPVARIQNWWADDVGIVKCVYEILVPTEERTLELMLTDFVRGIGAASK